MDEEIQHDEGGASKGDQASQPLKQYQGGAKGIGQPKKACQDSRRGG